MRPGDIPSVCIALAFRLVVRLGAAWSVLFTCLCLYTPQLLAASAFLCLSSLSLRAHMDELQNMRLPLGTTGWNHCYYTGIPHSAPHSLPAATLWCELPAHCADIASTRESHGAATPSSVFCPQVTHSAISPQVRTGSTRTITSDLMSATLAEAATQLSFAAFLERCISVSAPPAAPVTHLWMPPLRLFHTSLSLHATLARGVLSQMCPPHDPSGALAPPSTHDVLCPTCSRPRPFVTS